MKLKSNCVEMMTTLLSLNK